MPSKNATPNQSFYHSVIFDQFHVAAYETIRNDITGVLNSHTNINDYVFQLEKGDKKGLPHFQGYVKVNSKIRARTFELDLNERCYGYRVRVKPCSRSGRGALRDYCMKEDTRIQGPWGKRPLYLGQDLTPMDNPRPFQRDVLNYINTPGNDREIMYIWDRVGNKGKSKLIKYLVYQKIALQVPMGNATQLKANICQQGPSPVYVIDMPRTLGSTEKLADLYSAIEEIKNGIVQCAMYGKHLQLLMMPPKVIVFSNEPPRTSMLSRDKWDIYRISDDYKLTKDAEPTEPK